MTERQVMKLPGAGALHCKKNALRAWLASFNIIKWWTIECASAGNLSACGTGRSWCNVRGTRKRLSPVQGENLGKAVLKTLINIFPLHPPSRAA